MKEKTVKEVGAPDLIPRYWDDVNVKTEEDILFLGKITIEEMIISWERVVLWLNHSIKNIVGAERVNQALSAEQVKRLRSLHKEREREYKKISQLRVLQTHTKRKPPLKNHRPYHWFAVGGTVVTMTVEVTCPNKGELGISTFDFIFAEGVLVSPVYGGTGAEVSLTCDENKNKSRFEFVKIPYSNILLPWEFKYLREHPDFAKLWFGREVVF